LTTLQQKGRKPRFDLHRESACVLRKNVPGLTVRTGAHAFAQNQIAPSAPGAEGRLAFAEDRDDDRDHAPII